MWSLNIHFGVARDVFGVHSVLCNPSVHPAQHLRTVHGPFVEWDRNVSFQSHFMIKLFLIFFPLFFSVFFFFFLSFLIHKHECSQTFSTVHTTSSCGGENSETHQAAKGTVGTNGGGMAALVWL